MSIGRDLLGPVVGLLEVSGLLTPPAPGPPVGDGGGVGKAS